MYHQQKYLLQIIRWLQKTNNIELLCAYERYVPTEGKLKGYNHEHYQKSRLPKLFAMDTEISFNWSHLSSGFVNSLKFGHTCVQPSVVDHEFYSSDLVVYQAMKVEGSFKRWLFGNFFMQPKWPWPIRTWKM
jgi:hypothetical protein